VKRNTYTGKTYNSVDHIRRFFTERGVAQAPAEKPETAPPKPSKRRPFTLGSTIKHPRYGKGTIVRREGDGDEAKLTVSFPGYGLKKLMQKYAGLKIED